MKKQFLLTKCLVSATSISMQNYLKCNVNYWVFILILFCISGIDAKAQNLAQLDNLSDTWSKAPSAAYSTRKVLSSYTGAAMKLRRSNDDAQTDVFFDANGWVSMSSNVGTSNSGVTLQTWINETVANQSAYVTKWYDQSGNGKDATPSECTGTVTCTTGAKSMSGSGTFFSDELTTGLKIYDAATGNLVATVNTITNGTNLTTVANPAIALTSGKIFTRESQPRFINAGNIETMTNGRPTLYLNVTTTGYNSNGLTTPLVLSADANVNIFALTKRTSATASPYSAIFGNWNAFNSTDPNNLTAGYYSSTGLVLRTNLYPTLATVLSTAYATRFWADGKKTTTTNENSGITQLDGSGTSTSATTSTGSITFTNTGKLRLFRPFQTPLKSFMGYCPELIYYASTTTDATFNATDATTLLSKQKACFLDAKAAPTVSTTAVTAVSGSSATSGGNVTADGNEILTAKGVCWSINHNPTIADSKTTDGTSSGVFTSTITGFTTGVTYYVRAYATNSQNTSYGSETSFTYNNAVSKPTVTTATVTATSLTTASAGGNVTADGNANVTARGVCWSTSTSPTIDLSPNTTDGSGTGSFTSSITGLTAGTTYYVRAYATNSEGTSYGNEITYTLTAPTVTTTSASSVTATSASAGGNVTADGNAAISARGVCWSTSTNPTIDLSTKTTDGSGSGSYTSSITSLSSGTTYYMKAYATNLAGTSYGAETSFTTQLSVTANTSDAVKGSVSGGGSYASGATATLTATPLSGYRFINWTDNGTEVSNTRTYTFTVSTNKTLVANFGTAQSIYYVRPTGSTKWANIGATADQLITNSMFSLDVDAAGATKTYYFAPGTYTTPGNAQLQLTTGKLYGGFTGDEIAIDLNARATSDKDGNGLIEPWELTNEAILTTSTSTYKYSDTGTGNRFITVLGGELNGLTLTDYNYLTFGGAICLGQASGTPTDNASGSAGKLNRCTVRKIKSGFGVVMSTNTASIIDQCLIEDNYATTSFGGGVYLNRYGGTVSNTTIRNNKANTEGGAIYAGNGAAATDLKAIVSNCLIYNNTATTKGGAISCIAVDATHSGIEIVNSTIVNNSTGSGNASVEIDKNGLLVNCIITGDTKDAISVTSGSGNYVEGVAYSTLTTGSASLYPAINNASGKSVANFNFNSPTLAVGYVGVASDNNANYNAVHAANFSIKDVPSVAVSTTSLSSIPASYLVGGSGASITAYSSVPTNDIRGISRNGGSITVGAYQLFVPTVTVTVGTYTYNGSAQGPNTATNTGSGGSYTFSYSGTGYGPTEVAPTTAGSYTAIATLAAHGNYSSASSVATAFSIDKASQSITFGALPTGKTVGNDNFSPGATSTTSGVNVITYSSSNTAVATIVSDNIHLVGAGTCTIYADQSFSTNYNAASQSSQSLTVAAAIIEVLTSSNSNVLGLGNSSDVMVRGTAALTINTACEVKSMAASAGTQVIVNQPLTVNTGGVTLAPNSSMILANTASITGNVEVGAGANLKFTATKTLTVSGDLILKSTETNTENTSFSANIGNGTLAVGGEIKYLKTIDDKKWYFISFPSDVTIANITGSPGLGTLNSDWFIKYYDGAQRGTSGTTLVNWKTITPTMAVDTYKKLNKYQGYIIGLASGSSEITFTLDKTILSTETARNIPVAANNAGNIISTNHGWNLIGQPYLSKYAANTGSDMTNIYKFNGLTYTDYHNDGYGNDLPLIDPCAAYFTKVTAAGSLSFSLDSRQSVRSIVSTSLADIVFLDCTTATGTDRTKIIMDDTQSASYQNGVDYEKMITTETVVPQVYTVLDGLNYSYNVLPTGSVINLPLAIYSNVTGSTTISVDGTRVRSLSKLLLLDKTSRITTDLLTSDYTFTADAGTNNTRFAITAQRVPTSSIIEIGDGEPNLVINNSKLVINNLDGKTSVRVYDAIGRMVSNKTLISNLLEINLTAKGMYTVQIEAGAKSWVKKIVF